MTRFSYQRLDDGTWGIKASADLGRASNYAGQTVAVTTRAGAVKQVTLGSVVARWNGDRAATYTIAGRTPRQPVLAPYRDATPVADVERDNYLVEIADDIVSAQAYVTHVADTIRAALPQATWGPTERSAYYDTRVGVIHVDPALDVDANIVRDALAHRDGQSMASYGTFGGYSTIGRVSAIDDDPGAFSVESVYHIGD